MKIALIGATGNVGTRVAAEASSRGHQVTAISRHPEKQPAAKGVSAVKGDASDAAGLPKLLAGHDAVVSSTRFAGSDARALIAAVKKSGVKRLIVVGGAGSLEVAPGVKVIDDPHFPDAWKPEAQAQARALDVFRVSKADLDWTYISPAAWLEDGARTGTYRMGGDELLTDASGHSRISVPDYAVALLDRLDRQDALRQRITVAY